MLLGRGAEDLEVRNSSFAFPIAVTCWLRSGGSPDFSRMWVGAVGPGTQGLHFLEGVLGELLKCAEGCGGSQFLLKLDKSGGFDFFLFLQLLL